MERINIDDKVKVEGLYGNFRVVAINREDGSVDLINQSLKKKTVFEDKCTVVKKFVSKAEKESLEFQGDIEGIDFDEPPFETSTESDINISDIEFS